MFRVQSASHAGPCVWSSKLQVLRHCCGGSKRGGAARTINLCRNCYNESQLKQGEEEVNGVKRTSMFEHKSFRGKLWAAFGVDQFLRGMWERFPVKKSVRQIGLPLKVLHLRVTLSMLSPLFPLLPHLANGLASYSSSFCICIPPLAAAGFVISCSKPASPSGLAMIRLKSFWWSASHPLLLIFLLHFIQPLYKKSAASNSLTWSLLFASILPLTSVFLVICSTIFTFWCCLIFSFSV